MRTLALALGAIVLGVAFSFSLTGCTGEADNSPPPAETDNNPNFGQDAMKKMGVPKTPKEIEEATKKK